VLGDRDGGGRGRAGRGARRSPRGLALEALTQVEAGARANELLGRLLDRCGLCERDRHLVTELVYGTTRMRRACDWLVSTHLRTRTDPVVRAALRMGAYQLAFMGTPAHAAVDATVAEVSGPGRSVVNAVLRKVAAEVDRGLVTWPDRATMLSYPDWLAARLVYDLGADVAWEAMEQMNQPAKANERPDGYIQDPASVAVAAHLAGFLGRPGARVLDACAAPGGKASALCSTDDPDRLVVGADRSLRRLRRMASNFARLGSPGSVALAADATSPPWRQASFDLVLIDAPCSGLGVLRRRPDARYRVQETDLGRLARLQRQLIEAALPSLRPGGILAYCVCTLTKAETAAQDNWLARAHPELEALPPPPEPFVPAGRGGLLLPQAAGTDGMYLLVTRLGSAGVM